MNDYQYQRNRADQAESDLSRARAESDRLKREADRQADRVSSKTDVLAEVALGMLTIQQRSRNLLKEIAQRDGTYRRVLESFKVKHPDHASELDEMFSETTNKLNADPDYQQKLTEWVNSKI